MAIIARLVDGQVALVEVPRERVAKLMPWHYRSDGEQVEINWPANQSE